MNALKKTAIILGVLVAAALITSPLLPDKVGVSAEITLASDPSALFASVASLSFPETWDPRLVNENLTVTGLELEPGYVGSACTWEGSRFGNGRVEVVAVKEGEYIESQLWSMGAKQPVLVRWTFEPLIRGTRTVYSFEQDVAKPLEWYRLILGRSILKGDIEYGMLRVEEYLWAGLVDDSSTGEITIETLQPFEAMVVQKRGNLERGFTQMGGLYGLILQEAAKQHLHVAGAPFIHVLDHDGNTGQFDYLFGIPVSGKGTDSGHYLARSYPEMKVVQLLHRGPYEILPDSYSELNVYIMDTGIEVKGEILEFYHAWMMNESDSAAWQTLIILPLK